MFLRFPVSAQTKVSESCSASFVYLGQVCKNGHTRYLLDYVAAPNNGIQKARKVLYFQSDDLYTSGVSDGFGADLKYMLSLSFVTFWSISEPRIKLI